MTGCKNYSRHRSVSSEFIAARRTGPCPFRSLLTSLGLGLHKTYKSGWERSTPKKLFVPMVNRLTSFYNAVNGLENIL